MDVNIYMLYVIYRYLDYEPLRTLKHALMSASVACGTVSMSTPPSSTVLRVTMSMKPSSRKVMFSLQVVVYLGCTV